MDEFLSKSTRQRVKDTLTIAMAKLSTEMCLLKGSVSAEPVSKPIVKSNTQYTKVIDKYGKAVKF